MALHPSLGLTCSQYLCTDCRKELMADRQQPSSSQQELQQPSSSQQELQQPSSSQQELQQPSLSHGTCAFTLSVDNAGNIEGIFWNEEDSTHSPESEKTSGWTEEESSNSDGLSHVLLKCKTAHTDRGAQAKKRRMDDGTRPCTTVSFNDGEEIVQPLKEKFNSTTKSERLRILTILPKSWSRRKVAKVFGVSRYLARRGKMLVAEKGVLSSPNPKLGSLTLSAQTEEVKNFYLSDDISRIMPGKKYLVSVLAADGKREHKQKVPDMKIGFSKFAMLRLKECILAGTAGTHSVCVYAATEGVYPGWNCWYTFSVRLNIKLMMAGGKIESLTDGSYKHYRHCLAAMQCNLPNIDCHFGNCNQCPGTEPLHKSLQAAFDKHYRHRGVQAVDFHRPCHSGNKGTSS